MCRVIDAQQTTQTCGFRPKIFSSNQASQIRIVTGSPTMPEQELNSGHPMLSNLVENGTSLQKPVPIMAF